MPAADILRRARARAGLSQRALAERAGVSQSTIARIEGGAADPHFGVMESILRQCGHEVEVFPRPGRGVDATHLRENLRLTPAERLENLSRTLAGLEGWRGIAKRPGTTGGSRQGTSASQEDALAQ